MDNSFRPIITKVENEIPVVFDVIREEIRVTVANTLKIEISEVTKEIKKAIQIDINKNHLLNADIKEKINPPSDEEVKKFYEDNKSKFQRPEAYHTRHILAAYFPPEAVRNQTIEELKKIKNILRV